jgi:hypothetical protein
MRWLFLMCALALSACGSLNLHQRAGSYYRHQALGADRREIQRIIAASHSAGALVYYCPPATGQRAENRGLHVIPANSAIDGGERLTGVTPDCVTGNVGAFVARKELPLGTTEYDLVALASASSDAKKLREAMLENIRLTLVHGVELAAYTQRLSALDAGITALAASTKAVSDQQVSTTGQLTKMLEDLLAQVKAVQADLKRF